MVGCYVINPRIGRFDPFLIKKNFEDDEQTVYLSTYQIQIQQEYIERGGSILTTEKENALVPIKTGDTVYKSYEDLQRKSILMSGLNNGIQIEQQNFDKMFDGIESSIDKGFKKAKINNNINLIGFDAEQNAYRDSMTNW